MLTLLAALVGAGSALIGQLLARQSNRETDARWHREQSFVLMDKAITRALDADQHQQEVGIAQLTALLRSELLQQEDHPLLDSVTRAVLKQFLPTAEPSLSPRTPATPTRADVAAARLRQELAAREGRATETWVDGILHAGPLGPR
jgi:hypothetical protein